MRGLKLTFLVLVGGMFVLVAAVCGGGDDGDGVEEVVACYSRPAWALTKEGLR